MHQAAPAAGCPAGKIQMAASAAKWMDARPGRGPLLIGWRPGPPAGQSAGGEALGRHDRCVPGTAWSRDFNGCTGISSGRLPRSRVNCDGDPPSLWAGSKTPAIDPWGRGLQEMPTRGKPRDRSGGSGVPFFFSKPQSPGEWVSRPVAQGAQFFWCRPFSPGHLGSTSISAGTPPAAPHV